MVLTICLVVALYMSIINFKMIKIMFLALGVVFLKLVEWTLRFGFWPAFCWAYYLVEIKK